MQLAAEFRRAGDWLFRRRSYLPLFLLVLVHLDMVHFSYFRGSHAWDRIWELFCLAVSLLGVAIRVMTIGYRPHGTSGRNTRGQVAETLNTEGMYSIARHPLYLGNYFNWFGLALFTHDWWLPIIVTLAFWLYYERIMFAEEAFLHEKFGETYSVWAAQTPAFWPRLRSWQPPARRFSWAAVLRGEYSGLFAIVAVFTYMELLGDLVVERRLTLDGMWVGIFAVNLVLYLTLRALKRHG
ncbi:MAG TPA: isoprenylcysteine carboxylmethyltransferase family protein [Candidatus Dormibacteraeota bacterium]|nr:isoprenylcysteine carboxylmethyltransferase family protein [Candidatus Dormibacteraeota bacterium]